MKLSDEWFTALAESNTNQVIIISGREGINTHRVSGKFKDRVEVTWKYDPDDKGMPREEEAIRMEAVQNALQSAMEKNKLSILTGVYTGGEERVWVFYTRNVLAFGEMLNSALADFDELPISIYAEEDPDWSEYAEIYDMRENAE